MSHRIEDTDLSIVLGERTHMEEARRLRALDRDALLTEAHRYWSLASGYRAQLLLELDGRPLKDGASGDSPEQISEPGRSQAQ